ncbi:MAG: LEA type 2 family protein [Candidatus Nanohaloarchaea archaeon]
MKLGRILLAAVAGIGLVLGGAYFSGAFQKPGYGLKDMGDWSNVSNDSVEIVTSAWVHNPNPIGLSLSGLKASYTVNMNGVEVASGSKTGLSIPANRNTTIEIRTGIEIEKMSEWWASHVRQGEKTDIEIPVTVSGGLFGKSLWSQSFTYTDTVETDVDSILDRAVAGARGEYSHAATGTRIEILNASARFGEVTENRTRIVTVFEVHNPNSYPIPTPEFEGEVSMNNVTVADWKANEVGVSNPEDAEIMPGETRDVVFHTYMDNEKVEDWFITHVRNNESSDGYVEFQLGFDFAGQKLMLPANPRKCGFSFQTGILVDGQKSRQTMQQCEFGNFLGSPRDGGSTSGPDSQNSTFQDSIDSVVG